MAFTLTGKVFMVSGGASGIGLSTAKTLLERGARVGICDIHEDNLSAAISSLPSSHRSRVVSAALNVDSRDATRSFLCDIKSSFGRLDGIANVAGTGGRLVGTHELWQLPNEEYDYVMGVNVRGLFNCLAEALKPGFLEPEASIVNVGSVFSVRGFGKAALYSCSKHAMIGLTKSAAIEAGPRGVRVNAVLPGTTDTPLLHATKKRFAHGDDQFYSSPIARLGRPKEIAEVISFLLGPESSFVTGAVWNADGGLNA